jgi:hypothetical protein
MVRIITLQANTVWQLCRALASATVFCLLGCPCGSAFAALPGKVQASYEVYMGSLRIGLIDETFTRENDRYTLSSATRAVGVLEIFKPGKILLSSDGMVGPKGLVPLHFSDQREGDEKRNRRAEFDWDARQLTMIRPAERTVVPLPDGTQDRLSAMYQFMFLSLEKSETLSFNMTNGNKLDSYNYRITHDQSVTVPLGTFKAHYVASVPESGTSLTEIWLAAERSNFPCKIVITDPDGGKMIQVLTALSITQ